MRIWIERTAGWAVSYFQEAVDMVRMNDGVAAVVQECVDLMAITGADAFRVRTYEKAARSVGQMKLLRGTELNIGPEGGLDWPDEFLTGFDLCVASVHSHFSHPARGNDQAASLVVCAACRGLARSVTAGETG